MNSSIVEKNTSFNLHLPINNSILKEQRLGKEQANIKLDYGIAENTISELHKMTNGSKNVIVAVIDTGIDFHHPQLANKIWNNTNEIAGNGIDDDNNGYVDDIHGWNFINSNNNPQDNFPISHGTHVSGLIAADEVGLAPNVTIMPLKVINIQDGANVGDIINAIYYATDNGASIISMSLGYPDYLGPELKNAIDYATSHDIIVVAASGNENANKVDYPAQYPGVIAVGSVDSDNSKSSFSNYGTNLDLVAPGRAINSTVRVGTGNYTKLLVNNENIPAQILEYSTSGSATLPLVYVGLARQQDLVGMNLTNKIAIAERGDIKFSTKAINVKQFGGKYLIIYNNIPGNFLGTLQSDVGMAVMSISMDAGTTIVNDLQQATTDGKQLFATFDISYFVSNFGVESGTSMATPQVSGIFALLKTLRPDLPVENLIKIVFDSAFDLGVRGKDPVYGYGLIDGDRTLPYFSDNVNPLVTSTIISIDELSTGVLDVTFDINATDNMGIFGITYWYDGSLSKNVISNFDNYNSYSNQLQITIPENIQNTHLHISVSDLLNNTASTDQYIERPTPTNSQNTKSKANSFTFLPIIGANVCLVLLSIRKKRNMDL